MAKCILEGMTREQANAYADYLNACFPKEPSKEQSLVPIVKIADTSKLQEKAPEAKK